jgi:lysyl-tRNA synthetase, class II
MARVGRALWVAVVIVLSLGVVAAASGWLYFLQAYMHRLGLPVRDAVPLDELPHHDGVPLLVFVAVWGAAVVLLGLLARSAGAERLTAALALTLGVGLFEYLQAGASIAIVRQIPGDSAFRAAGQLDSVYLPAALAGLAGALLGRHEPSPRARGPMIFAWLVAAAGLIGVLDAVLPGQGATLAEKVSPEAKHAAVALAVPVGLALVFVAPSLARGRHRAWQVATVLLGLSATLHLLHADYGAVPVGLLALALVARRQDFQGPGDPEAQPRVLLRGLLYGAVIAAYGVIAIWVNREAADGPFSIGFALHETGGALVGLDLRGGGHLMGEFGGWFGLSVRALGILAAASLLQAWIAPWRYRQRQQARERELAHDLVAAWGADTLAPFVLRADKSYFFSDDLRAFLAYRVVGGVAIVSGDPVGPPGEFEELTRRFIEFARTRDWRIAILGASERWLERYRRHGLHALYHGDEAVIDTGSFTLEGRPIRKVRQSVHRLERASYRVEVRYPNEIDGRLRAQLEAVARAWRGGEPNRGFAMALDALFRLEDEDAVFVIGFGPDGSAAGFLHFAVSRAGSALSLSSMPRLHSTPNGFIEWLVCEAVAWAREQGFARVSLNFAPFAALLAPEAELSSLQKVERRALLALKGRFQLDNLLLFNRKFFPGFERRFVVYERRGDLPRVGIAALAAEAYLPFSGKKDA